MEPEERKNVPVPVPGISRDAAVLEHLPGYAYGTGGPSAPTRRYLVNAATRPCAVFGEGYTEQYNLGGHRNNVIIMSR